MNMHDVVKSGNCSQCGLCAAFRKEDFAKVCPRMNIQPCRNILGDFIGCMLTKGISGGSYSGSVTSLLEYMIGEDIVDGVLTTTDGKDKLQARPLYATSKKDIANASGMRHTVSSHLSIMNKIPKSDRIAIVGLPCHIEAVSNAIQNNMIKNETFLISMACGTNYDYCRFRKLVNDNGVDADKITGYTLRKTRLLMPYFQFVSGGKETRIPVSMTTGCIPSGCMNCNDYLGRGADISFGVLGAPAGWSIAFVRTKKGMKYLHAACKEGYLHTRKPGHSRLSSLYRILPKQLYMSAAFRTSDMAGAGLMAEFKIYLNQRLRRKNQHQ